MKSIWPTDDLKKKTELVLFGIGDNKHEKEVEEAVFNLRGFALTLLKMKMEDQYASRRV